MSDLHFRFWPERRPRNITLPDTSLWHNLEVSAARYVKKTAAIFYDSPLTYDEMKADAERLAGFLQRECGVRRGDRVALYLQNSPQFVIAYYAILRADAVVVPINCMNLSGELSHILRDAGAKVIIAAQDLFSRIEPSLGDPVQ